MASPAAVVTVTEHVRALFGPYLGADDARRFTLGLQDEPGFIRVPGDLELTEGRLPFQAEALDCILSVHVFQRITHLARLVGDCHRILRPGGFLIAVTPHCGSDDAWDHPAHVRAFSERTWEHVVADEPGWRVELVNLIPYEDLRPHGVPIIGQAVDFEVQEVHAVLQKVEA